MTTQNPPATPMKEENSDQNAIRGMIEVLTTPVHVNCDCRECSHDKFAELVRLFNEANDEVRAAMEAAIGTRDGYFSMFRGYGDAPRFNAQDYANKGLDVSAASLPDLLQRISGFDPDVAKANRIASLKAELAQMEGGE